MQFSKSVALLYNDSMFGKLVANVLEARRTVFWHPERTAGSTLWHSMVQHLEGAALFLDVHHESRARYGDDFHTRQVYSDMTEGLPSNKCLIVHHHSRFPFFKYERIGPVILTIREPTEWAISFFCHRRRQNLLGMENYFGDLSRTRVLDFFRAYPQFKAYFANWIYAWSQVFEDEAHASDYEQFASLPELTRNATLIKETAEELLQGGNLLPIFSDQIADGVYFAKAIHGITMDVSPIVTVNAQDDYCLVDEDLRDLAEIRNVLLEECSMDVALYHSLRTQTEQVRRLATEARAALENEDVKRANAVCRLPEASVSLS